MSLIHQEKAMHDYEVRCSECLEEFTCFPRPSHCAMCGAELEPKVEQPNPKTSRKERKK